MDSTTANITIPTVVTTISSITEQNLNASSTINQLEITSPDLQQVTNGLLTTTDSTVLTSLMETTMNEPSTTTTIATTVSDIVEVITLPPTETTTLITLTSSSTTISPTTITETTNLIQNATTSSIATTNNYSESVLSTIISSVDNTSVLQKETLTLNEKTSCKLSQRN